VNRIRIAAVAALALVLVACGGDDDAETPPAATEPGPGVTAAPDPNGPDATVSPDLPDSVVGEVGPLEVQGESLPALGQGTAIADDPALGAKAPVLIGQDFDGATVRLDASSDGPTMAVFLAHWCPHCNAEVPRINELRDEGRFPEGLNVVAVSTAVSPDRPNFPPSEWFEDIDWTYPVIRDGVNMQEGYFIGADAYGVDGFPFTVLLDAEGNVAARWSGEHDTDEIIEMVDEYLPLD
jgi:thiol-disulfide isomerase/thioredoxin